MISIDLRGKKGSYEILTVIKPKKDRKLILKKYTTDCDADLDKEKVKKELFPKDIKEMQGLQENYLQRIRMVCLLFSRPWMRLGKTEPLIMFFPI